MYHFYINVQKNYTKKVLQALKCELCVLYGSLELFFINFLKNHLNCFEKQYFLFS